MSQTIRNVTHPSELSRSTRKKSLVCSFPILRSRATLLATSSSSTTRWGRTSLTTTTWPSTPSPGGQPGSSLLNCSVMTLVEAWVKRLFRQEWSWTMKFPKSGKKKKLVTSDFFERHKMFIKKVRLCFQVPKFLWPLPLHELQMKTSSITLKWLALEKLAKVTTLLPSYCHTSDCDLYYKHAAIVIATLES